MEATTFPHAAGPRRMQHQGDEAGRQDLPGLRRHLDLFENGIQQAVFGVRLAARHHRRAQRLRETHVITNSAGRKISIPENLYALQKDGSMKQIECWQYFREQGDLYNIGDKLVFIFDNAREFITDCFIYPSGRPDNELAPPGKRVYGVTVFAEFDPIKNIFKT